jgi:DsbC/DsbD-like thiol-disulfide interchange protein
MNHGGTQIIARNAKGDHISNMRRAFALPLFLLPLAASPAYSASSQWIEAEGARVRLVTSGLPDQKGALTGALEIELAPGWKTYWRDPGEVGVPPSLDLDASTNIVGANLSFPAPQRFKDSYATWTGYKSSVALPVRLMLKKPTDPISANVFLGVCEAICIPVQGALAVDPAHDPENAADASIVEAALALLPAPEQPGFGVTVIESTPEKLVVEASFPGSADAVELFLAGDGGYALGTPQRLEENGKMRFSIALLDRPASRPVDGGLPYTLVTSAGAVEGLLPYP